VPRSKDRAAARANGEGEGEADEEEEEEEEGRVLLSEAPLMVGPARLAEGNGRARR
jgi:hypothetical protein